MAGFLHEPCHFSYHLIQAVGVGFLANTYLSLCTHREEAYMYFFISQYTQMLETCPLLPSVFLKTLVYKASKSI